MSDLARIDEAEPDFGVKCMHGREECAGNVQQLCVAKYQPRDVWWQFLQCQNSFGRERVGNAELALYCAKKVGFDWENGAVGQCAGVDASGKGVEGVELLKQSALTAEMWGIR